MSIILLLKFLVTVCLVVRDTRLTRDIGLLTQLSLLKCLHSVKILVTIRLRCATKFSLVIL